MAATKINVLKFANSLQSHEVYTEEEKLDIISKATNQYEYDSIIDALYFKDKESKKDRKNRTEYSYYTARGLHDRRKREDSIEYLTDVKHIQFKH
nr:MAG: hypothetical protein [Bacteriophage sp.]